MCAWPRAPVLPGKTAAPQHALGADGSDPRACVVSERRGLRYIWQSRPRAPAELLAAMSEFHPLVVQILHGRDVTTESDCRALLAGGDELHEPTLLRDL